MTNALSLLSSKLSSAQMKKLEDYYQLLIEANQHMNLTAIVEREAVYVKHFYDSLSISQYGKLWSKNIGSAIDVGTGAGFPGIVLAVARPDIEFTLCDSLRKRTDFLNTVVQELKLQNVAVIHSRAEDLARMNSFRNSYDLVLSRAVARLNILVELLVPFAKPMGHVVCYKGPDVGGELEDAKAALKLLGARTEHVESVVLPEGYGTRSLVVFRVEKETNKKFPRKAGIPQRQPL